MMKVYTITCQHAKNYGAVLQTYALAKYLDSCGHNVEVIDYVPNYLNQSLTSKKWAFNFIRSVIQFPDRFKGEKVFGKFLSEFIPLTSRTYYSYTELQEELPPADAYVVGSDQIWNMNCPNGNDDSYFLKFAPSGSCKISYAASLAMDKLSLQQESRLIELTKDFTALSIRENSGTELINSLGNQKAVTVVDPVFLLDAKEWMSIMDSTSQNEKYILVYAFYRQKEVFEYAMRMAREKKCKVYFINTPYLDFIMKKDKYFWCATPNRFIKLIHDAESVVTNSFHGLSFSLIFHKDVHVFYPNRKGNSRIKDLLELTNLSDRVVRDNKTVIREDIDYISVDKALNRQIDFSKSFLRKSLEDRNSR